MESERLNGLNFSYAKHASDKMFQQAHRAMGTFEEISTWFYEHHANYGLKTEAFVHAEGVAIIMMLDRPGRTGDIEITREFINDHL